MVQRTKGKNLSRIVLALLLFVPFTAFSVTFKHDGEKYSQWNSMENGGWNFRPGFYYYVMHKKYSGAKMSIGFFEIKYSFRENKSNVKRCAVPRLAQVPIEEETASSLEKEVNLISPLVTEETVRFAQRNIDPIYGLYKDDFKEYGGLITEAILYAQEQSGGKLFQACTELQSEYDVICSQIDYISQVGPTHEIEPTKRQDVYEDCRDQLIELAEAAQKLAYYAKTM